MDVANWELQTTPSIWLDSEGRAWTYTFSWREANGRIECSELNLLAPSDTAVGAEVLRRFPIGRLIAERRRNQSDLLRMAAEDWAGHREDALHTAKMWEESHAGRSGPKGYGAEHFAEVASIYRREAMVSNRPTAAVAERFVVSKSAAAKWVARARTMGLLPSARKGKVG